MAGKAKSDDSVGSVSYKIDFPDISSFKERHVELPKTLTAKAWRAGLRSTEIDDHKQKLKARPFIAWGVGILLLFQNVAVFTIVYVALCNNTLQDLQLIFSALIAGSLTQSYFLLRLITEKVFGDIDYHNGDSKNNT
jgi:hypothetical protein